MDFLELDSKDEFELSKAGNQGSFGSALVEVFNVRIDKQMEVCGTFSVVDRKGTVDFYRNMPENHKLVEIESNGALLPLISPPRVIPATDTVTFCLDLKDKCGHEFIKKSFPLDLMCEKNADIFDKYQVARIEGTQGSAEIYYMIASVAFKCSLTFELIKGDNGRGHSDVEGKISVHYGNSYANYVDVDVKQYSRFTLYDTCVQLKDEDVLPLSRSSFVIPNYCSVIIEMNLKLRHSDGTKDLIQTKLKLPTSRFGGHVVEFPLDFATLKLQDCYSANIDGF